MGEGVVSGRLWLRVGHTGPMATLTSALLPRKRQTPKALLRAFAREQYARDFIAGGVRVGLLPAYRSIEGSRRDDSEGSVRVVWDLDNPVFCDRTSMNSYYILATSDSAVDIAVLRERFGPSVVRINDPLELLRRIDRVWSQDPLAIGRCVIKPVVYNKDELRGPTPGLLPPVSYSFAQKPGSYEIEREFRYVLTYTCDAVKLKSLLGSGLCLPNHRVLPLGDCSDICGLT